MLGQAKGRIRKAEVRGRIRQAARLLSAFEDRPLEDANVPSVGW